MSATVFRNARIIDGSGDAPFRADVRVVGNRIAAIERNARPSAGDAADVVDCAGATLMPGLIEPHAHLSFVDQATPHAFVAIPVEEHVLLTLKHAKLYLDQGFTSCFSAAATKPRLDIVARNAIDRGEHPGPRLKLRACSSPSPAAWATCARCISIPAKRCTRCRATDRSSSAAPRARRAAKASTC